MLLLGVLALVQIFLLPGAAVAAWWRRPRPASDIILFAVVFSLLFNYVLVWLACVLGLYTRATLFAVVAVEAGSILVARLARRRSGVAPRHGGPLPTLTLSLENAAVLVAVAVSLAAYLNAFLPTVDEPFLRWDAIVSWNRWAVSWAEGNAVTLSYGYPQLVPILWSLTYVALGTTKIQLVASNVDLFFPIVAGAALLPLGRGRKLDIALALAAIAYLWFWKRWITRFTLSDYVDMPLAAILLVYAAALVAARDRDKSEQTLLFYIAGMAALVATAMKFGGLVALVSFPVLVLAWSKAPRRPKLALVGLFFIPGLAMNILWYGYTAAATLSGAQADMASMLISDAVLHEQRGIAARLGHALWLLWRHEGVIGALLVVLGSAASLFDRRLRLVTLLITLPLALVWATAVSYDIRNFIPALGVAGFVAGGVLATLARSRPLRPLIGDRLTKPIAIVCVPRLVVRGGIGATLVALLVAAIALARFNEAELQRHQTERSWRILNSEALNRALMSVFAARSPPAQVLTDYDLMPYLPGGDTIDVDSITAMRSRESTVLDWLDDQPSGVVIQCYPFREPPRGIIDAAVAEGRVTKSSLAGCTRYEKPG